MWELFQKTFHAEPKIRVNVSNSLNETSEGKHIILVTFSMNAVIFTAENVNGA